MCVDMNVLLPIEKVNKNYRLRNERLYGSTILNNHNFRKYSTFCQKPADSKPQLMLSPTNAGPNAILEGEDYASKVNINTGVRLKAAAKRRL